MRRMLIVSRAQFFLSNGPRQSDLFIANRDVGGNFQLAANSQDILRLINTPALEYAPAITADLLELYFTRCHDLGNRRGPAFEIMVARRTTPDKPFGAPQRLSAIDGFVEAPITDIG